MSERSEKRGQGLKVREARDQMSKVDNLMSVV